MEQQSVYERFLGNVKERKLRKEQGLVNSIPSPFVRFSDDFIGIEKGKFYLVSSYSKGGKSQFTSYSFVFHPLFYAFEHQDKVRVKFFMYLLEETPEDFIARFSTYLIFKLSHGKIIVDRNTLLSTKEGCVLSDEILEIMESEDFKKYMDFFEQCTIFSNSSNPTGVFNECTQYAKEHGTIHTKEKIYKDEFGIEQTTQGFDYYESNDEDEYRIVLVDHISLIQQERGYTLKQSIDKLGEYCILLRNRYGFSPVLIQQQSVDGESLDAQKMNKMRPSVSGLGDSKYNARNCDVFLGLFSPFRFELKEYHKYDITKFKDNIRFLEVVLNRGGRMGGIVALYFNGACCHFQELPLPDSPEIQSWYNWLEKK